MILLEPLVSKADKTHRKMIHKLGDRIIKVLKPARLDEIHVLMPIPEASSTNAHYHSESAGETVAEGSAGWERAKGQLMAWKLTNVAKSVPLSNPVPTADGNGVFHVTLRYK
ncbi:hypothetical protein JMJ35_010446 [Cladonia borealis]|uniref:Uncharacterized protein n=1 Tax=Cladonia borealis TaxID=184061 RepID=A0AA39QQR0_9LECA|nr:hypothetical protein JMJ35_010446 [Cladonia borealis]